ncbi:GTP cyclohydrolase [Nocardia sp. NPDC019395]|uniref:GTP cyclohydrolase n=1 Tax=Nocardia sp. NPDC019395 TaxID=3154686 RepID=UPI0033CA42C9
MGDPREITSHTVTRKGLDQQIRVVEMPGGAERGHILIFGDPVDGCPVRIHSRCLYGESLGFDDCDCGLQLDTALSAIQSSGAGVLVYLEQEGRAMGLVAKAHGYHHSQRFGVDTFASYEALGYPADARTYTDAARALRDIGLTHVRLLTGNPLKVAAVREAGIAVTPVALDTPGLSPRGRAYLEAKRRRQRTIAAPEDSAREQPGH